MRLVTAVIGFLGKKLFLLVGVMVTMFIGLLVIQTVVPSLQQAAQDREQLDTVIAKQRQLETELEKRQRAVTDRRDEVCGFVDKVIAVPLPGNVCKDAQRAVDAADKALANTQKQIRESKAEQARLEESQGSVSGRIVDLWSQSWKWLLGIALVVLFLPPLLRTFSYFVLMPLVVRAHRPIHLAGDAERPTTRLEFTPAKRVLPIRMPDGEVLSARSEHVRPVAGKAPRGRLLYDWSSPFVSFAAGLYGLTRVTGDAEGTEVTLATPNDPDSYLMRIDFADHPGVVMRPRHVVGVLGTPELQTRWRWGIQAFATWQVRYIMFTGTGSLIVQGSGDVVGTNPGGRAMRMEQNLLMGFDSRLDVGVHRTEVFWPYLWGRTPLVDDHFTGSHPIFWQKSTDQGPRNPVAKVFDAIFSSLGKVLGF